MKHHLHWPLFGPIVSGQLLPPRLNPRQLGVVWHWIVVVGLVIWLGISAWARDPVPAEYENASPEGRQKILKAVEEKDRESLDLKLRVGERRYNERMEFKTAVVADLNRDVAQQQEQMASAAASSSRVPGSPSSRLGTTIGMLALAVAAGCGLLLRRFSSRRTVE